MDIKELEDDMELITISRNRIHRLLNDHKRQVGSSSNNSPSEHPLKYPYYKALSSRVDNDSLVGMILERQIKIKEIVQIDQQIAQMRQFNKNARNMIEKLREQCSNVSLNSINRRQSLIEAQQKEIDDYRTSAAKSLIDEHKRFSSILKSKRKECEELKQEIKNEETTREEYLRKYEEELNQVLERKKDRHIGINNNRAGKAMSQVDEDDEDLQLFTYDEYHPYGTPPHQSKRAKNSRRKK